MEPNFVGAEMLGRLSYTGGSPDDGHDASKGSWYGQLDLSGVDGRVGKSWAAYYRRIYSGPAANHHVEYQISLSKLPNKYYGRTMKRSFYFRGGRATAVAMRQL